MPGLWPVAFCQRLLIWFLLSTYPEPFLCQASSINSKPGPSTSLVSCYLKPISRSSFLWCGFSAYKSIKIFNILIQILHLFGDCLKNRLRLTLIWAPANKISVVHFLLPYLYLIYIHRIPKSIFICQIQLAKASFMPN